MDWTLIFIAFFSAMLIGLVVKCLQWSGTEGVVLNRLPTCIAAILVFVVAMATTCVGSNIAVQNAVTFNENWNGYEVRANWQRITCTRDGPCTYEYDCDPWIHVHVETRTVKNADGSTRTETYTENHTHYHECPYVTEEWVFSIDTTLGAYHIAHNVPDNPQPWRERVAIPDRLPRGVPEFWQAAHDRIGRGDPGPVVKRMEYENYILANQNTILKQFSGSIERYKAAGQLPGLSNKPVHTWYWADKVFFVGVKSESNWQFELNQFNAALGMELQGDMYLVIVDANAITDPDDYTMALIAYWGSEKHFGKDAISKNGIVVVLGTRDGKTVEWARAQTGMPIGNENMLLDVQNTLPGTALTPAAVLGHPRAAALSQKPGSSRYIATVEHTAGALEKVMFGEHRFERVCMKCDDPEEQGKAGYKYLKGEIQPSGGAKFLMVLVTVFLSLLIWVGAAAMSYSAETGGSSSSGSPDLWPRQPRRWVP